MGEGWLAREIARRLAAAGTAETLLSSETRSRSEELALDLGGSVAQSVLLQDASPTDALIVCDSRASRVRDAALWAARTCPYTALIIAARDGLSLCRDAARGSGLAPYLILSPGGLPRAAAEAARLARHLDVSSAQVDVPVVGGEGFRQTAALMRYATAAGVPAAELADIRRIGGGPGSIDQEITEAALAASAIALARAVIEDRRQILCCGAWVEGAFGLTGAFVTAPVRIGYRGAEEPLPLRLTLEERALIQRAAALTP